MSIGFDLEEFSIMTQRDQTPHHCSQCEKKFKKDQQVISFIENPPYKSFPIYGYYFFCDTICAGIWLAKQGKRGAADPEKYEDLNIKLKEIYKRKVEQRKIEEEQEKKETEIKTKSFLQRWFR